MATYVNDLRLKEIATGDEAGTWGTSTNTNLELIGEALGYGTQDCFASDADATTTVADGATDPARAMYFKVTSSATLTATRTLTIAPNTISRVMLIENATTGSQSIAISQGSGGNVTIANGAVKMVYLDGAGAGAAVVDALADLELGTITVANLTATTADINGGTIDGVTIGGASAGAGTFTNLTATGTTTLAGASTTADITFGDNDKAIFGAGSDLQIFHDGNNSFISEAGTGVLAIQTNGANVIIQNTGGTANAVFNTAGSSDLYYNGSQKLATTPTGIDVTGTVTADGLTVDAGTDKNILIGDFGGEATIYTLNDAQSDNTDLRINAENLNVYTDGTKGLTVANNGDISFYEDTGTTPKFFWDASAERLGIGTTSPNGVLETNTTGDNFTYLRSGDANTAGIIFGNQSDAATASIQMLHSDNSLSIRGYNNAERMRITSAGNVGIGTTSPLSKLSVQGDGLTVRLDGTANTSRGIFLRNTGASGEGILQTDGNMHFLQEDASRYMRFSTANTERMRIDSSGNVGIGDTSPSTYGKLVVAGSTPFAVVRSTDVTTAGFSMLVNSGSNGVGVIGTDDGGHMTFDTASTGAGQAERMRLDASGNLGIGTTSPLSKLNVKGTQGNWRVDPDSVSGEIQVLSTTTANDGFRAFRLRADEVIVDTAGSERMRIDSSGRVGIGTTSPTQKLHLVGSGDTMMLVNDGTYNSFFGTISSQTRVSNDNTIPIVFATNSTERARIDSSGNLLVGKTTTSNADAGIELNSTGQLVGTFASGSHILGRNTDDGAILTFNKDNTAVGSIGASSGDLYIGTGDTTLLFVDGVDLVIPTGSGGATRDAAISLGNASNRFKNLYLSGGVYLGGTGAANLLDDYEEGTWTPVITGGATSITYTEQVGTYTKVGRMVMLRCLVRGTWTTTGGVHTFGGLPFTANSSGTWASAGQGSFYDTTLDRYFPVVPASGSSFYMVDVSGSRGILSSAGSAQTAVELMFIYETA